MRTLTQRRWQHPQTPADAQHQHGVVRTLRALKVSLLCSSTAGGREFESRRHDWFNCSGYNELAEPGCLCPFGTPRTIPRTFSVLGWS